MDTKGWDERLGIILTSWAGTPFMHNQCCKGIAVDCRYFICAVLDAMYGITDPLPPRMPVSTAVHDRKSAFLSVRQISSRYPSRTLDADVEPLLPGDVVIIRGERQHADTLQHAMIVGPGETLKLWHASKGGVGFTTLGRRRITHAFRPVR